MTLHVFPFIVPWLKKTVASRVTGWRKEQETVEKGQNYEIQKRKSCFNKLSTHVCSWYLGTEVHNSVLREALKRKAFWCEQRDDFREEVVSSCCFTWVDPTAHSTTTLLPTLVAYCDKHAIDAISVILRFYNKFMLIVIILWLTVLVLIDWCWVWTPRVVIWSPMWFSLNIKTFGLL